MLRELQTVDFIGKGIKYHSVCRVSYQNRVVLLKRKTEKSTASNMELSWHFTKKIHQESFDALCFFVD